MAGQINLLGMEDAGASFVPSPATGRRKAASYQLFFAICFDRQQASALGDFASSLCREHGSAGAAPMHPDRLHITLRTIAAFSGGLPMAVIDAARSAADAVRMRTFEVTFDQLACYPASDACMLLCKARGAESIDLLLKRRGVRSRASAPHMTAHYDAQRGDVVRDIDPIACQVTGFKLLISHRGATVHETVGAWSLS